MHRAADGNDIAGVRAERQEAGTGFESVLFARPEDRPHTEPDPGAPFFADLHLDQIIDAIIAGREDEELRRVFATPLTNIDAIRFRHEVFRDLEDEKIFAALKSFAADLAEMRVSLANVEHLHPKHQKQGWFLDAAAIYGEAVAGLADRLKATRPGSRGLRSFLDHLADYSGSAAFERLRADTEDVSARLATIRYCLEIRSDRVRVRKYEDEEEYSSTILATFARFKDGGADNDHAGFLDPAVARFDREIQFYLAFLEHKARIESASLSFCYPEVLASDKTVRASRCFDLALAENLRGTAAPIVCNDFFLNEGERIFVVSGPNQGGKTTFARTFGQMHFLASIGCPVPGTEARLFLFDRIFTHFDREEAGGTLNGRLEDDLLRVRDILLQATPRSIVILNEIFSSTTLSDAQLLGKKIMARIVEVDLLCIFVTFIDELADFDAKTVSMVSATDAYKPDLRSYRIERRPADGLAYAMSIAEKYGLTYPTLKERFRP
jgi:hypothetical protein